MTRKSNNPFLKPRSRPLETVLLCLSGVKPQGRSFVARCPAHDDRHPSLRVTETDDGIVLLKCWTGCNTSEIVSAIRLELRDLFPANAAHYIQPVLPAIDPQLLEHLQLVRQIGENWIAQGKSLSDIDLRAYENAVKITDVFGEGDRSWIEDPSPETASDSKPPVDMESDEVWDRIETQIAQRTAALLKEAIENGEVDPNV